MVSVLVWKNQKMASGHSALLIQPSYGKSRYISFWPNPDTLPKIAHIVGTLHGESVSGQFRLAEGALGYEIDKIKLGGEPNFDIEINGLNEKNMIGKLERYEKYGIPKYNAGSNNCCHVVMEFLNDGIELPDGFSLKTLSFALKSMKFAFATSTGHSFLQEYKEGSTLFLPEDVIAFANHLKESY